eukprot:9414130-Ditylum_brightwellii.AAC.1
MHRMASVIHIGYPSSALVGPFQELAQGARRQSRQWFYGTVIQSAPSQKWTSSTTVRGDTNGFISNKKGFNHCCHYRFSSFSPHNK